MLGTLTKWMRRGAKRDSPAVTSILKRGRDAFGFGDIAGAMDAAREALALDPDCVAALKLCGIIFSLRGEHQAAIRSFQSAMQHERNDPELYIGYGNALRLAGRHDDAEVAFRRAILLRPDTVDAHMALGNLLVSNKRNAEGMRAFEAALEIAPGDARVLAGIGGALVNLGRYREAAARLLPLYEQGKLATPDQYIVGQALTQMGELERGREILELAYRNAPQNAGIALALGINYLLSGRWQEGFELYERRHDAQIPTQFGAATPWIGYLKVALADTPAWTKGGCDGKRLLIWGEQGLGDNLMMLRALPVLERDWHAKSVTYLCTPLLEPFGTCFEDIRFLAPDPAWRAPVDEFDLQCSIMSLPHVMGICAGSIPGGVPYIHAPKARQDCWRDRVAALPGLKVGLVWAGGTALSLDHLRSLSLTQLAPLVAIGGISFISLQKDAAARDELRSSGLPVLDWMGEAEDFLDTAGLVSQLDLVIAVDTALAHLAGAMARPIWMLNRFESEWRWMRDREDSVWYPTMRIFSQPAPGDWSTVVQTISVELTRLVAAEGG